MQTFDLTLKDILMDGAPELFRQATGFDAGLLQSIELPAVTGRRLDLFGPVLDDAGAKVSDDLVQMELQAQNDGGIDLRMLEYYVFIKRRRPAARLHQVVLYLGYAQLAMPDHHQGPAIDYRFRLVDARRLDAGPLLASDREGDILMALFAGSTNMEERIRGIIRRLADRLNRDVPRMRRALHRLLLLSPLRRASDLVEKEIRDMPLTLRIDDNPYLKRMIGELVAETTTRTKSAVLRRLLEHRFGGMPDVAIAMINNADDDALESWTLRVLDAQSIEEVFDGHAPS